MARGAQGYEAKLYNKDMARIELHRSNWHLLGQIWAARKLQVLGPFLDIWEWEGPVSRLLS